MSNSIKGQIKGKVVKIGRGAVVEEGALICGPNGDEADEIILGDYCYIGHNTKVMVPMFKLGDYSKLHANSFARGEKPMQIGRNCWIGGNSVLDSLGGLDIDDNVGIGAHSQIWTHIQFGDIVEGCKFFSKKYMHIGKDAWFVGHSIVSPVKVGEKAMALVGSVITRDMEPNHIYAGSPAKDLTEKLGTQFEERTAEQKADKLKELIAAFEQEHPEFVGQLKVVTAASDIKEDGNSYFNTGNRTYTKRHHAAELAFLKKHVPLIKFIPHDEPNFIVLQEIIKEMI